MFISRLFATSRRYASSVIHVNNRISNSFPFGLSTAKSVSPLKYIEPQSSPASSIEMLLDSVMRKRRLKMKKHKLRKRRKAQRAMRIKLKK
ncbi:Hypothetical protein PP7435_CHR2-2276 [Komagataella phaffii CBS 7435]|uniref:Ribosomal protein mS38 C-terminal domain-containing protein n=1 Tax=Komagataella phaffii (strain ATCC 76273 / CBS 7435 / CECT 11047 / NRRL Y-11430 / Wegner 21-1) TaxID=981350 RepID=A0A1G4KPX5_KOMPC|nr:Hypothetical protein BQ9382_C2-4302 [Komagataella phaffii CBS 7435]SCV12064.1 Hypothetical protein PP7435_CHR2-2276 [Komagataella phaffii CBS 7435]